jgi:hypothetical protein
MKSIDYQCMNSIVFRFCLILADSLITGSRGWVGGGRLKIQMTCTTHAAGD